MPFSYKPISMQVKRSQCIIVSGKVLEQGTGSGPVTIKDNCCGDQDNCCVYQGNCCDAIQQNSYTQFPNEAALHKVKLQNHVQNKGQREESRN